MRPVRFKLALGRGLLFGVVCGCMCGCPDGRDRISYKTAPVRLDLEGAKPAVDYSDLAAVLKDAVRGGGRVEPAALKRQAARLRAQLKRLAVTGPKATPQLLATPEDRLAYWYNARAAWTLALALRNDCPEKLPDAALIHCRFPLDGREMTIRQIDAILARNEDWRAAVVAPGIRENRARLPTEPFSAGGLRERIATRLGELIDDDARFEIDHARKVVLVPPVLWPMRQRLIAAHHRAYGTTGAKLTTALLDYVTGSAHRRLQDAIGLRCVLAPDTDRIVFPPEGGTHTAAGVTRAICARAAA